MTESRQPDAAQSAALVAPAIHGVRGPRPFREAPAALKDHEVAALVNRLTVIAREFHGTQQLRERIACEIRPVAHGLAAPAAVATPSKATLNQLREWEAKGELLERAWGAMVEQEREIVRLESTIAAPQPQVAAQEPVGLPYGIIDPDYARVFTTARSLAWYYGFALTMHGSFTRDLDLVLVPWSNNAFNGAVECIIKMLCEACDLSWDGTFGDKPHGRKAYTLMFKGFFDPRWIDLSVLPVAVHPATQPAPAQGDAEDTERLAWLEQQSQVNIERVRYLGAEKSIYEVTPYDGDSYDGDTLREAIDAARAQAKEGQSHE